MDPTPARWRARIAGIVAVAAIAGGAALTTQLAGPAQDDTAPTSPTEPEETPGSAAQDTQHNLSPDGTTPAVSGGDVPQYRHGEFKITTTFPDGADPDTMVGQCVDEQGERWSGYAAFEITLCLEDALLVGVQDHGPADTFAALDRAIEEQPTLGIVCHGPSHRAGAYAYEYLKRPVADTMILAGPSCGGGYLHGALDGWSITQPDPAEFPAVREVCTREGFDAAAAVCADGIGHASWSSTRDLDTAVEICQGFGEAWARNSCAEGILMQMFDPAGVATNYTLDDVPTELPDVCRRWPDDKLPADAEEGPRDSCYHGSSYLILLPYGDQFTREGHSFPQHLELYGQQLDQSMDTCRAMGEDAAEICSRGLGLQLMFQFVGGNLDHAVTICSHLNELADACTAGARSFDPGGSNVTPVF